MRPVLKLKPEDTIIINGTEEKIQATYKTYQDAKPFLAANIGEYCSYCERPVSDEALQIEHIQPKSIYKSLEYAWSNFLLTCQRCNGKDNKSDKDVILENIHLPHLQNTMMSIEYKEGGFIKVNSKLEINSEEYQKAKNLINLVGLDKRPGHSNYKPKDKRWQKRFEAWQIANRHKKKFQQKETDIESIIGLAQRTGFFSIWLSVFENNTEFKIALIHAFEGTAKACFDKDGQPKSTIERV